MLEQTLTREQKSIDAAFAALATTKAASDEQSRAQLRAAVRCSEAQLRIAMLRDALGYDAEPQSDLMLLLRELANCINALDARAESTKAASACWRRAAKYIDDVRDAIGAKRKLLCGVFALGLKRSDGGYKVGVSDTLAALSCSQLAYAESNSAAHALLAGPLLARAAQFHSLELRVTRDGEQFVVYAEDAEQVTDAAKRIDLVRVLGITSLCFVFRADDAVCRISGHAQHDRLAAQSECARRTV